MGEQILALWLYLRKLQFYSHHSYYPPVNQLLPGAGRMFKAWLGLVRTSVLIQWNPVYRAFHRILGCGNEAIVQ